jgi:hypothetical protein
LRSSEYIAWSLLWDAARRSDTLEAFMEWAEQQGDVIRLEWLGDTAKKSAELDQRDEEFTRARMAERPHVAVPHKGYIQEDDETHAVNADGVTVCGNTADIQAADDAEITCGPCAEFYQRQQERP